MSGSNFELIFFHPLLKCIQKRIRNGKRKFYKKSCHSSSRRTDISSRRRIFHHLGHFHAYVVMMLAAGASACQVIRRFNHFMMLCFSVCCFPVDSIYLPPSSFFLISPYAIIHVLQNPQSRAQKKQAGQVWSTNSKCPYGDKKVDSS